MVQITSSELLARANRNKAGQGGFLEPFLVLNGGLRATHFIASNGNGAYFHAGIDGKSDQVTGAEFLSDYPDALGAIWWVERFENVHPVAP